MKTIKSFIVCSDQHTPFHDKKVHQSFLKFIKDFKPDGFIINGDFVDMYSVSSFIRGLTDLEDNNKFIKLENEFAVANSVLDDYDKVLPKNCEKHYLFGNHCERLNNYLAEGNRGVLTGLISVKKNLHLQERGYKVYPDYPNNYLTLGKLIVTHGVWCPVYTASKHLNEYRQSVLFSHSHTVQMFYAGGLGVKQVGINIGHLCDVNSKGMKYAKKTSRWVQGWAIVTVEQKTGYFWVQLVNGFNGRFMFNKTIY